MTRWKVALVCDWFLPRIGGLELLVRDLARALNQRGHEAHIICSTRGPAAAAMPETEGLTVHRLDVPLLPLTQTVFNRQSVDALERVLLRERYDLVHAHTVLSPLAHAATFLAHKHGLPSLLTEHSVLRGAPISLFRALRMFAGFAEWPTLLTAVSGYVADDLRRIFGRQEVHVLLNATNLDDWLGAAQNNAAVRDVPDAAQVAATEPAKPQRVTTVMRFTKRKRPVDLVRMIPMLQARLPKELWPRFTLVGDGPEMPRVRREVARLQVGEWVELPGFQPRASVREILGRSSVFVMPCYKEAMSIAAVEARAMGLPVVARKPNGVAEVIEHGTHGFLAADDPEFIEYLARLLSDPALHRRMSHAAQKGLERFTWEHSIRRHLELYELARSRVADRGAASKKAPRPAPITEPQGEHKPPAHTTPPSNWGAL